MELDQPMQKKAAKASALPSKQGSIARFFRELVELGKKPDTLVTAGSLLLVSAAMVVQNRNGDGETLTNNLSFAN